MKILVKKEILLDALLKASRAAPSTAGIKEITGILISAKKGILTLTGYDLSLGIVCDITGEIIEEGSIIAPPVILDIIRKSTGEEIEIFTKEVNIVVIRSSNSEFELFCSDPSGYPELPYFTNGSELELAQSVLRRILRQTVFAVSTSEGRPVQQGVLFELENKILTAVALDGFRMAVSRENTFHSEKLNFVIPGKTLVEILKLISDNGTIKLFVGKSHACFELESCRVYTRLITQGEFINYRTIMPTSSNTSVTVKTKDLIEGVERVSLLVDMQTGKKVKSSIIIRFGDNQISLGCVTMTGKAHDKLNCVTEGTGLEISVNNSYLLDALKASDCDEVVFKMTTAFSAIRIVPPGDESFIFLIMPVRTRNEE